MISFRSLLLALLIAIPLAAQSPYIEPADPTSTDRVTLFVFEQDSCPPDPVVTRNGLTIEVVLGIGPCLSPPTLITHRIDLGVLPPGRYVVFVRDNGELKDSFTFQVREASNSVVVRPSLGPTRGGTVVEIRTDAAYCSVPAPCTPPVITFGGVPATDVVVLDPVRFRATTPAHAAGPVEVRVAGSASTRSSFAFRYYDPADAPLDTLFERILFPVIYNGSGSHGSMWATELSIRNDNEWTVEPWRAAGTLAAIPPGTPRRFSLGEAPNGVFLIVPRESAPELHFNALVRDTTQQATAWGTELPVVRESDWSTGPVELLNVPLEARFRNTLRLYADTSAPVTVRVTAHSMDDGRQLLQQLVTLAAGDVDHPAYLALGEAFFGHLPASGRTAIRAETVSGRVPLWAFVTVTNNETQHVTVISPQ